MEELFALAKRWARRKKQLKIQGFSEIISESYGSQRHNGLKPEYLNIKTLWEDIPNTFDLAKSICPDDSKFSYLHAAQLIKHILGLKVKFSKDGFKLLYLWYDVWGEEGSAHRSETEAFSEIVKADGIAFHAMTYQEMIVKLSMEYRQENANYVKYLTERYL